MKITTEELEKCEILMTIEVEPAQEQELLKQAAKRVSQQVRIPGFRPGKAPYNTVVRRFGLEAIQREVLEQSVEKLVKEALLQTDVTPYAQAQLDDVSWDPLTVKLRIPTEPIVELGHYRDIRLEPEPIEVSEEDVEHALKALQDQHATWVPVERPSEEGDLISMSVLEKDADEVLAEQESVEYELVPPAKEGDNQQPDLTTPLLGLSAGDTKTFTVTYPENFNDKRFAGKDITFTVEVSGVKVKELDPLDDDFAQTVSDVDTLAELQDAIRENIKNQRQYQRDLDLGAQTLNRIIENAEKIEWPLALEEESIKEEFKNYEERLKSSGLTLDNYLQMQHKTREELTDEIRPQVVEQLRRGLVLGRLAEFEKLNVSNVEVLEQAKFLADYSRTGDQFWRNVLASETQQRIIANDLLSNKILHRLATIAKGEAPALDRREESIVSGGEQAAVESAENETAPPTSSEAMLEGAESSQSVAAEETDSASQATEESVTTQA